MEVEGHDSNVKLLYLTNKQAMKLDIGDVDKFLDAFNVRTTNNTPPHTSNTNSISGTNRISKGTYINVPLPTHHVNPIVQVSPKPKLVINLLASYAQYRATEDIAGHFSLL